MTTIPVFDVGPFCMDWTMVDDLLNLENQRCRFKMVSGPPEGDVAVIRVAAQHVPWREAVMAAARVERPVFLLMSDEEHKFDVMALVEAKPDAKVFVQSPDPHYRNGRGYPHQVVGFLPMGYSGYVHREAQRGLQPKTVHRGFWGQITHQRRYVWRDAFGDAFVPGEDVVLYTNGFMQGLDGQAYAAEMAKVAVVPAPPGPCTPDTFRFWEALELGAAPIVEDLDFWAQIVGSGLHRGFEVMSKRASAFDIRDRLRMLSENSAVARALAGSWYSIYRRRLRLDIERACGVREALRPQDDISVVISVSPIQSHPDTAMIEETVRSIRELLPVSEIFILCDGVRPEQMAKESDYYEHVQQLNWLAAHRWDNVQVCFDGVWRHQAMTLDLWIDAMPDGPILFVEHDTPFNGRPIDWLECLDRVRNGDVVRFHFMQIPDEHQHMIHGRDGNFIRTSQWSQRPHLTTKRRYLQLLIDWFRGGSRTMIEDVLHSPFAEGTERGIVIYAPEENIIYTRHLDGRGDEEKYEMWR